MSSKILALIPTYNHSRALSTIITLLKKSGLTILVVDDGSDLPTKQILKNLKVNEKINLLTLAHNQGKGIAVHNGLKWAKDNGFTHAFQIDADGQHSLDDLKNFLELSHENPNALISGQPIYDQSMPLSRRIGRWFTHVWVWIETLSFRITDSMCGFRIYPVEPSLQIFKTQSIGARMDFDTQIMVHLFWQGIPVIMSPVKVIYPEGNTSNFDVIKDNWRITKMHTRLFFSLLFNLFSILKNRPQYQNLILPAQSTHWASLPERAPLFGLFFLAYCYRLLGKKLCMIIGTPIIIYYYIVNKMQRQASQDFLKRVYAYADLNGQPHSLFHFFSFFEMALDKFGAWTGAMTFDQVVYQTSLTFKELMKQQTGGMLMVSHIGNMEFCRAAATTDHKRRLHILLHTKNAQRYHQFLKAFNPLLELNIVEVSEIDPGTMIYLKDKVEQGDWVVLAGDRAPLNSSGRVVSVPFLGQEAKFSQGPYILASLLGCPVYMTTAIRDKQKIRVSIEKLADKIELGRLNKDEKIKVYAGLFSEYLQKIAIMYPYQWFNFFNFWK